MPTKIEWCDETLNPFWGCTHGCSYCQARRIAHMRAERIGKLRGYPPEVIEKMKRFEPVWLPDADRILAQIHKWKKPKTIFMGFMGDIAYQRNEDISYMLDVARVHPEHKFLMLTKKTKKYSELSWSGVKWPANLRLGTSITNNEDARERLPSLMQQCSRFISLEPLLGGDINRLYNYPVQWFIIGALTDRRGQPVPAEKGGTRLEWVLPIIEVADKHNIPVFLKNNLLKLYPQLPKRQEFPW